MDGNPSLSLTEQFAAIHEWWRDAGVDGFFSDTPAPWLHDEAQEAEAPAAASVQTQPAAPPMPAIGGAPESWPGDLSAFQEWWMADPALDPCGGAGPRISPRGPADAGLAILVPQPEAEDADRLLSGPQGGLLSRFLAAAGIAEGDCYLASALPRHAAFADIPALADAGLAALTRHHVFLANPGRLLVFGQNILPLIGHDPAQSRASFEIVNHQGRSIPVFASRSLEFMLQRPAARSRFWQRWLNWTGTG